MAWGEVSWLCKTTCHDNEVRLKVESARDLICIKGRKGSKPGTLFFSDCFGKICMTTCQPTGFTESQDSCSWVYFSLGGKSNLLPLDRIGMSPVCSSLLTHWCRCDCFFPHNNPLKLFSWLSVWGISLSECPARLIQIQFFTYRPCALKCQSFCLLHSWLEALRVCKGGGPFPRVPWVHYGCGASHASVEEGRSGKNEWMKATLLLLPLNLLLAVFYLSFLLNTHLSSWGSVSPWALQGDLPLFKRVTHQRLFFQPQPFPVRAPSTQK